MLNLNIDVYEVVFFFILMQIDIWNDTNNNFVEDSSSVLITTDPNKKIIGKENCNLGNFVFVLFNDILYPGRIIFKSKEGRIIGLCGKEIKVLVFVNVIKFDSVWMKWYCAKNS